MTQANVTLKETRARNERDKQQIYKIISEGCATTAMIAADIGATRSRTNGLIRELHREKKICRIPFPLREGLEGTIYVPGWQIGADSDEDIAATTTRRPNIAHSGACQVTTKARQVGMFRHWLDVAFFGADGGVMA